MSKKIWQPITVCFWKREEIQTFRWKFLGRLSLRASLQPVQVSLSLVLFTDCRDACLQLCWDVTWRACVRCQLKVAKVETDQIQTVNDMHPVLKRFINRIKDCHITDVVVAESHSLSVAQNHYIMNNIVIFY